MQTCASHAESTSGLDLVFLMCLQGEYHKHASLRHYTSRPENTPCPDVQAHQSIARELRKKERNITPKCTCRGTGKSDSSYRYMLTTSIARMIFSSDAMCPFLITDLTLKVLVVTTDAQWEGMGDVGSARYEPALLPPCPTIRVLSYSN